ncbi:MAG: cytidylate kinase-like family protein [Prevotella sp.]|nr:cytidylate kinase-like family protein [Prevotella sp.]
MDKSKKFVITVNREMGSKGRTIAEKLAEKLNVRFYDKAVVDGLTKEFGVSVEELERVKAKKSNFWGDLYKSYIHDRVQSRLDIHAVSSHLENKNKLLTSAKLHQAEERIMRDLAEEGSCVIAGRSGFHFFRDEPNSMHVFIQCSKEKRIQNLMTDRGITAENAEQLVDEVDRGRNVFTRKLSGSSRYDSRNYNLVLDVSGLTIDQAVDAIYYIVCL